MAMTGMVACLLAQLWGWAAFAFVVFILLAIVGMQAGIER